MKTNHQRNFKGKNYPAKNGFLRVGKDKFVEKAIWAFTAEAYTNGSQGEANQIRGVKKYVKSRVRFHGKMKLKKILKEEI